MSPIDSTIPWYPVNDFGPLMKGLVIGGVGIVHVFLAQFAIGGGMLMWYFERARPARAGIDLFQNDSVIANHRHPRFAVGACRITWRESALT